MHRLTERQQEVLELIKAHIRDTGMSPTRAELADMLGFQSKNAANDHLKALARKGYIQLHAERSRGIQLMNDPYEEEPAFEGYELPIIGSVAAGEPIEAIEHVERKVSIPDGLFRDKPTYLLRVRGDSMKDAGILDGDLIAVRKASTARHGEIIVARINNEVTVKELKLDKQKRRAVLQPYNDDYQPMIVPADELVIEGVFVGLIRDRI